MTDTHNPEGGFDAEERRQQIIAAFEAMDQDRATKQIAILPYYHQIEHEITKPNRGIFVTDYFLMRWAPALGTPAVNIVLALRKLANKDGQTFASLDTIANVAGIGRTTLTLWLSTNEDRWTARRSEERLEWELLHRHFLRSKSNRYLIRQEDGRSRAKRTTNLYQVAMDDPVHPDDMPKLYVIAAERMVKEEMEQRAKALENKENPYTVAPRPNRTGKVVVREGDQVAAVENSPYTVAPRPHVAGRSTTSLSSSYRDQRSNVSQTRTTTGHRTGRLAQDPRVANLTPEKRAERERMADLIDQTIKKLEHNHSPEPHKSAGFYRKVALLMDPTLIHEALAATQDAMQRERSGEHTVHKGPAAYFGGAVLQIALKQGIDLGMGQPPAERRIEALAGPWKPSGPGLPATTGAQDVVGEESTPEEAARIYAEHLFPWKYAQEHDGREPSDAEKQTAYERRLEELRGGSVRT